MRWIKLHQFKDRWGIYHFAFSYLATMLLFFVLFGFMAFFGVTYTVSFTIATIVAFATIQVSGLYYEYLQAEKMPSSVNVTWRDDRRAVHDYMNFWKTVFSQLLTSDKTGDWWDVFRNLAGGGVAVLNLIFCHLIITT